MTPCELDLLIWEPSLGQCPKGLGTQVTQLVASVSLVPVFPGFPIQPRLPSCEQSWLWSPSPAHQSNWGAIITAHDTVYASMINGRNHQSHLDTCSFTYPKNTITDFNLLRCFLVARLHTFMSFAYLYK